MKLSPLKFPFQYFLLNGLAVGISGYFGFIYSKLAMVMILALWLAFGFGYVVKRHVVLVRFYVVKENRLRFFVNLLNFLITLALFAYAFEHGYISTNFLKRSAEASLGRFMNELRLPAYIRIANLLLYTNAILSSFLETRTGRRHRIILVLALFSSLLFSARAGFLLIALVFISIKFSLYKNGSPVLQLSRGLMIKSLFIIGALVLVFFPLVQVLRIGRLTSISYVEIMGNLSSHFFGSFNAFSIWFRDSFHFSDSLSFGQYTFHGPYQLFFESMDSGIFTERVEISEILSTNVFTVYRGVFMDFGIVAFILFFLFGLLVRYLYAYARAGFIPASIILSSFYLFVIWSLVINPLGYTTILLAFLLSILVIAICRVKFY